MVNATRVVVTKKFLKYTVDDLSTKSSLLMHRSLKKFANTFQIYDFIAQSFLLYFDITRHYL